MNKSSKHAPRTRGVKPGHPTDRASRVGDAVKELEEIGAAFSVADVAERAGISRATIYRDHALRALVGARGDGVRPVDADVHARVCERHQTAKATNRELRQRLRETERSWDEMRERALAAEKRAATAEERSQMLAGRLAVNSASHAAVSLSHLAVEIGIEGMRKARRQLAPALHPDLFAQEPQVAAVASELLRALNEVVK